MTQRRTTYTEITSRPFRSRPTVPGRRRRLIVAAMSALALTVGAVSATTEASAVPAPAPTGNTLAGKTVFLDPGHQGSAAGHDMNAQVPDGRGGKKACQTSGATSVNGVGEHTVNWDVAQLVKAGLESQGARVVLSRADDTGWGGCIDERAAAASRSGAAVAVSLHADSTTAGADDAKKGFHMIVPTLPVPDATVSRVQGGEGRKASEIMRDAFVKAGFPAANYAGVDNGLQTRPDIAAVNLTTVPAVFVEMGNLSNPQEAAALTAKDGQLKYAMAITDGILNYVRGVTTPTDPPSATGPLPDAAPAPTSTTPAPQSGGEQGLEIVIPFVQQLLATEDPAEVVQLLLGEGQDVSAQVLKAMLTIIYGLFDGDLPIG